MKKIHISLARADVIDNKHGLGKVPGNYSVNYAGIRVRMKPSMFLRLAEDFNPRSDYVRNHVRDGGKVASPVLFIRLPDEWFDGFNPYNPSAVLSQDAMRKYLPRVVNHEGRHRMLAVLEEHGDYPLETFILLQAEDYSIEGDGRHKALYEAVNRKAIDQDGHPVNGPLWKKQ